MDDITPVYFSDECPRLSFNDAAALVCDIDPAKYDAASPRDPAGRELLARVRKMRALLVGDANATPKRLQADVPTKYIPPRPPEYGFGSSEWQIGGPPAPIPGKTKPDYTKPNITRAALAAWCGLYGVHPAIFAPAPNGDGLADESGAPADDRGAAAGCGRDQLELLLIVGALAQAKGRDYLKHPSTAGRMIADRLPGKQVSNRAANNYMNDASDAMRTPAARPAHMPNKRLNPKTRGKLLCVVGALLKGVYVEFDDNGRATLDNAEAGVDLIAANLPPDAIERSRLLEWLSQVPQALDSNMK